MRARDVYLHSEGGNAENDDVIQACAPQLGADHQHPVDRSGGAEDAEHNVRLGTVPRPVCAVDKHTSVVNKGGFWTTAVLDHFRHAHFSIFYGDGI